VARKSGEDVVKVSKRGTASGKKPKAKAGGTETAQRRKDPVFMKNLESAIRAERARVDATPTVDIAKGGIAKGGIAKGGIAKGGIAKGGIAKGGIAKGGVPATTKAAPKPEPRAKAAANQSRKAGKSDKKALAAELASLMPQLDSEGLAFLIEQARVHIYNMRVAELEDAAVEAERASNRVHATGVAEEFQIHAAGNGSSYDLVWHDKWKMFTDEEMLAMVRITSSKDAVADVAGRLYRWLLAERRDVIADIPFSGLADPKLRKLVALLRKTFAVKGRK
jgi:hypothetical protein